MYAVIATGGKQERVEVGATVAVERLEAGIGDEVRLRPVLVVARPAALEQVVVTGRVVGEVAGPKVRGFVYKPKARARRRFGHRQRYHRVEITGIEGGGLSPSRAPQT